MGVCESCYSFLFSSSRSEYSSSDERRPFLNSGSSGNYPPHLHNDQAASSHPSQLAIKSYEAITAQAHKYEIIIK